MWTNYYRPRSSLDLLKLNLGLAHDSFFMYKKGGIASLYVNYIYQRNVLHTLSFNYCFASQYIIKGFIV